MADIFGDDDDNCYPTFGGVADPLIGTEAGDTIQGYGGTDDLIGLGGADFLYGGDDGDELSGGLGDDTLEGGAGDDALRGGGGADVIRGGSGNDWLIFGTSGGVGPGVGGTLLGDSSSSDAGVIVRLGTTNTSGGGTGLDGDAQGDTYESIANVWGGAGNDVIRGTDGQLLFGPDGLVTRINGDNELRGNDGNDTLDGRGGNDTLDGGEGNDTLVGGSGADRLSGDRGIDTASYASSTAGVTAYLDGTTGSGGDAQGDVIAYYFSTVGQEWFISENLVGSSHDDRLFGNFADNMITGGAGSDYIFGGAGNDRLLADGGFGGGDDILEGGAGADTLIGAVFGGTTASYASSSSNVNVDLTTGVTSGGDAAGDTFSGISNLIGSQWTDTLVGVVTTTISGSFGSRLDGGGGDDFLRGSSANDSLIGGAGADRLTGLAGDDIYYVDTSDLVYEASGQGNDTVFTRTSYALQAGQSVETLSISRLAPDTLSLYLYGNEFAQTLIGDRGVNVLDGKGGVDTMRGGGGDDRYIVDDAGDSVVESVGAGDDRVTTSVSYRLAAGQEIEHLSITAGSASTSVIDLYGNEFDNDIGGNAAANILEGGGGNDILNGRKGADTMRGGTGDDVYAVDDLGDRIFEAAGQGTDTVYTNVAFVLAAGQEIEVLTLELAGGTAALNLVGNEFAQTLVGNAGDNILVGGGGADTLRGLGGNDLYSVDNTGDVVFEAVGGGTDRVSTTVSYTLAAGQSIEGLYFTNTAAVTALNLVGNELAQSLTGNAGDNILVGGGGADSMRGLGGNDLYSVDNSGDLVFEAAGGGTDRVASSVSFTLGAGQSIESLYLTDAASVAALNLTGNDLAQNLTGNAGDNILVGGGGADTLRGLGGNDLYSVDNSGDLVFEAAAQGTDRVASTVSYTLTAGQSIESLYLSNAAATTALNLVGNALGQTLSGNAGNNLLDGKDGFDTLRGYGGNDSFQFSTALGAGNVDHIADFSAVDDTIRLRQSVFSDLGLGTLTSTAYKDIASGAVDANDRILYDHNTGYLYYDADGSGAGARTMFAILDNKPATLTHVDFLVVA